MNPIFQRRMYLAVVGLVILSLLASPVLAGHYSGGVGPFGTVVVWGFVQVNDGYQKDVQVQIHTADGWVGSDWTKAAHQRPTAGWDSEPYPYYALAVPVQYLGQVVTFTAAYTGAPTRTETTTLTEDELCAGEIRRDLALAGGPASSWTDEFTDASQLESYPGLAVQDGVLALSSTPGSLVDTDFSGSTGSHVIIEGGAATLAREVFPSNRRLSEDAAWAQARPDIAAGPDLTLYAVWEDYRDAHGDIYLARSLDHGQTWVDPRRLNDDAGIVHHLQPVIAIHSLGVIHVAWTDYRSGNADIYTTHSTDGGLTWSPNQRVSDDNPAEQSWPALAVDGQHVYVVWNDNRSGSFDIYFARSLDGGATWSAPVRVDTDSIGATQQYPVIATRGNGDLVVAWQDNRSGNFDIYVAHSLDDGVTWYENAGPVNQDATTNDQFTPAIAISPLDHSVHLVWEDRRAGVWGDIYYSRSLTVGQTISWITDTLIYSPSIYQNEPDIAIDQAGRVHIVWQDQNRLSYYDVGSALSLDNGFTWQPGPIKANDIGTSTYNGAFQPAITLDTAGNAHAIWQDTRRDVDLYHASRAPGVTAWSPNYRVVLPDDVAGQSWPETVFHDGTLHLAWTDTRYGDQDIFYAHSTDQGLSWSVPITVSDPDAPGADPRYTVQDLPRLAVGATGPIHIAWRDNRTTGGPAGGERDLYYAYSADGGETWSSDNLCITDHHDYRIGTYGLAANSQGTAFAVWSGFYNSIILDTKAAISPTWGVDREISPPLPVGEKGVALAIGADDALYVVYHSPCTGGTAICFLRSADNGVTWTSPVTVSTITTLNYDPVIAVGLTNTLHIAWRARLSNRYEIRYRRSANGGNTWENETQLYRGAGGDVGWSDLAVDHSDNVYATWAASTVSAGPQNIYFSTLPAGGTAWTAPLRVDDDPLDGDATWPKAVCDATGTPHIFWGDLRRRADNIYYTHWSPGYYLTGTLESRALDAFSRVQWDAISWSATTPPGTALALQTRTGDTPTPGVTWSAWSGLYTAPGQPVSSPPGRYIQYRAVFSTTDYLTRPVLDDVTVTYHRHVSTGQATSVAITPGAGLSGWHSLAYSATVPASTTLRVDVCDGAGAVLLPNVSSGADLTGLNTPAPPASLKLRAQMSTADMSRTPRLDGWTVWWTGATTTRRAIMGQVTDGYQHYLPGLTVALLLDGVPIAHTSTDERGVYRFADLVDRGDYRVRVTLQPAALPFRVLYGDAGVVPAVETTPALAFNPSSLFVSQTQNVDFRKPGDWQADPAIPPGRLGDLAAIYYHTYQAVAFIVSPGDLGVTPDYQLPLDVWGYAPGLTTARYDPATSTILLGEAVSNYHHGGRPMNREWHESFHHLMQDTIGIPPLPPGDQNHGGYDNSRTNDSWAEGYAEFWPAVLWGRLGYPNPHLYRFGGEQNVPTAISLEYNWQPWDRYHGRARSMEEFAVASLLWDLYDPVHPADDDFITLPYTQVWSLVGTHPITDVKDLYDTLAAVLPISDVDRLFIAHGFFADLDDDHEWDPGEEVGRAADSGRPGRRDVPSEPNAYIRVTIQDSHGNPVDSGTLIVDVRFSAPDDIYNYSYEVDVGTAVDGGLVYLELPPTRTPVTVTLFVYTGTQTSEVYTLTNVAYWDKVESMPPNPPEPTPAFEYTFTVKYRLYLPLVVRDAAP